MVEYGNQIVVENTNGEFEYYPGEYGLDLEELEVPDENGYYAIVIKKSDEQYFKNKDKINILDELENSEKVYGSDKYWTEPMTLVLFKSLYYMRSANRELDEFLKNK